MIVRKALRCLVLSAAVASFHGSVTQAANKTWATGNGSWNVAANWSPSGLPAAGDAVLLTSSDGTARTVTYDAATAPALANTVISAGAGGTFTVNQGSFTLNSANLALGTAGRGTWNKAGGTIDLNTLNMATAGSSAGTFSHSGGVGTIDVMNIGVFNGATVSLSGGTITSGTINVGQSGFGTLLISGGALNVSGGVIVGSGTGPGGFVRVSGTTLNTATLLINSGGRVQIGAGFESGVIDANVGTLLTGGQLDLALGQCNVATFHQNGGTISTGYFVNGGDQYVYNSGVFTGRMTVNGSVTFNADFTASDGLSISSHSNPVGRAITLNGFGLEARGGTFSNAGTLNTTTTRIGTNAASGVVFEQSGGLHAVSEGLRVGFGAAPGGTYNLNGGTLSVPATAVDGAIIGATTPGFLSIGNGFANIARLVVGDGAAGTVSHSGTGDLAATTITIGNSAVARYQQASSGAAVTATVLTIAQNPAAANSEYLLASGTLTVQKLNNNGNLTLTGGRAVLSQGLQGDGVLTVANQGSLTLDSLSQGIVQLDGNGRIFSRPHGNVLGLSVVQKLKFIESTPGVLNGKWDLTDNAIFQDYTGQSTFGQMKQIVASGFAGGSWNGPGVNSSAAAGSSGRYGLGVVESGQVFSSFPANFLGQSVDDTAVLVRYTLRGDADLSRTVDLDDFTRLAAHFGTASTWSGGDFNYDDVANLDDFTILAANFGSTAAAAAHRGSVVPEPMVGVLSAILGGIWQIRRRRR